MDQLTITPPEKGYDVHGVKPWTILQGDSRVWQARKKWWLSQGLDDRAGRPDSTIYSGAKTKTHQRISGGGSVFDPVLAEALIAWYSPPGGRIVDPTAGGPTRGIVSAALGRHYTGIDLLAPQVETNRAALRDWPQSLSGTAVWQYGAAQETLRAIPEGVFDYALTCPPYWDLERYSDDPRDLSAMTLGEFHEVHAEIIRLTVERLKADAFATWVIGDKRLPNGSLARLPQATIKAFADAGMSLINDQILVTPIGSKFWTLGRTFRATRTATRRHQYVLTFVKGDRRRASQRITTPEEGPR